MSIFFLKNHPTENKETYENICIPVQGYSKSAKNKEKLQIFKIDQ